MTAAENSPFTDLELVLKEARRRPFSLALLFSIVALTTLAIGLVRPRRYVSSTVLVAESSGLMRALAEGTTSTGFSAALAKEVIYSRKTLRDLLKFGGWLDPPISNLEEERELLKLRGRIGVESPLEGRIRISYSDPDPERSCRVTNRIAEVLVREIAEARERVGRDTLDFIEGQVKEYGAKLAAAHQEVLNYYHGQEQKAGPPSQALSPWAGRITPGELAALRAEEASLAIQLSSRPSPTPTPASGLAEAEYRARVTRLQADLDRLRATYTEQHPDVKRIARELSAAEEELRQAVEARLEREGALTAVLDDEVDRAARARLWELRRRIAAATDTAGPYLTMTPSPELTAAPEILRVGLDTTLAELLRRYESIRDIYQDLLKRREVARVAQRVGTAQAGIGLRVLEPAEVPLIPTGLRLLHFCVAGLAVALAAPAGLLFALVYLDPRIRSADQVERRAKVPLLVSIPGKPVPWRERLSLVLAVLLTIGVCCTYVLVFLLKLRASS